MLDIPDDVVLSFAIYGALSATITVITIVLLAFVAFSKRYERRYEERHKLDRLHVEVNDFLRKEAKS